MRALRTTRLLGWTLGLVVVGCSDGDDGGNDAVLEAGVDSGRRDSGLSDSGLSDSGASDSGASDAAIFACTSYTPPTATMCGGSHCQQTPEQLQTDTPSNAVCGAEQELEALCSLTAVTAVSGCAVQQATGAVPDTKACAAPLLPGVSSGCLDCYVSAADCAIDKCLTQCLNPQTTACDQCRLANNCIDPFYTCSGVTNPLPVIDTVPDAGLDSGLLPLPDAGLDSGVRDSGASDAAIFACTSYTPPTATMCGGSHCQQTLAQLQTATPATAACGTDQEVAALCSLKAVTTVSSCAVAAAFDPTKDTKACAAPMLPEVSSTCLDCYVAAANCAKEKCLTQCLNPQTTACDQCRLANNCVDPFYTCSGVPNPLPPH